MKDAVFQISAPDKLAKIIEGIDKLELDEEDSKGDLYEYMLSKLQSSGTNGQFRTPRHIIKMMVELVTPEPGDVIADKIVANLIQIKKIINTSKTYELRASRCFCVVEDVDLNKGLRDMVGFAAFLLRGGCIAGISPFAGCSFLKEHHLQGMQKGIYMDTVFSFYLTSYG